MLDLDGTADYDNAALRREVVRLRAQVGQLAASARLQAMRAGAHSTLAQAETNRARDEIAAIRGSLAWRLTLPLRIAVDLARGAPATGTPEAAALRRAFSRRRAAPPPAPPPAPAPRPAAAAQPSRPAALLPADAVLAPSVLIVAELSLAQCAKYRVWQKQEHYARLGIACRVVDWNDAGPCLSAAALATRVILYRVPGYAHVLRLIEAVQALELPLAWEVDDIIFDRDLLLQNRNADTVDPEVRAGLLSGVPLYRAAMLACGRGIASTPCLAQTMQRAGLGDVALVENALDDQTLDIAARLRAAGRRPGSGVVIAYGSGTNTHDADFREAEPALLRLLQARPGVRLRIVGDLALSDDFAPHAARIERIAAVTYPRWLELLSAADISIAPLEASVFNDAKSNIKFLEAASLGVPSVCSPRDHFARSIRDGETGLLADGAEAWFAALVALCDDAPLRERIGRAALADALARYSPGAIARNQVAPLLGGAADRRPHHALRVLFANIYYAPRSFGGATLVAEEMARRLHARGDTAVSVVTGLGPGAANWATTRTDQDGIAVFGLPVNQSDAVAEFDNPSVGEEFGRVLDAVQPDVVHLHSVQWLSASIAVACADRGIPYVITLHDAWWLCARQFMVRDDGRYCFQTRIDLRICQNCIPEARHLADRAAALRAALDGAALLLSPSEAHRQLYLANGIDPARIEVAPNGVRLPSRGAVRAPGDRLRFAYVGGAVEVKGFSLVRKAFEALDRADWRLTLVDNTLSVGYSSIEVDDWSVRGELAVAPPYAQDELDAFFAGVDVLLFPSQWRESFGLTVREALARDVWVIATEGGGPAEAIEDGVNGTLIPLDGDHRTLLAAIRARFDDGVRRPGWRNPRAGEILGTQAQADALHATLSRVARRS